MTEAEIVDELRRLREAAVALHRARGDDPVLAGRTEYLVAYLQDTLRLKDPVHELLHVTELLEDG